MAEKNGRVSKPVKKGIRSILKGLVILGSLAGGFGLLGLYLVGAWNAIHALYYGIKKNGKKFLGYSAGTLLSLLGYVSPGIGEAVAVGYGVGLEATGVYRVWKNKELFYDNPGNELVERSINYPKFLGYRNLNLL